MIKWTDGWLEGGTDRHTNTFLQPNKLNKRDLAVAFPQSSYSSTVILNGIQKLVFEEGGKMGSPENPLEQQTTLLTHI